MSAITLSILGFLLLASMVTNAHSPREDRHMPIIPVPYPRQLFAHMFSHTAAKDVGVGFRSSDVIGSVEA